MSNVNTVMIVTDKQELVGQISQKLVLLRELDKIKSSTIDSALDLFEQYFPNTIILHLENNNPYALNLIKNIKKQEKYKYVPILVINDNCSRETIIEAYDSGITDILFMPIIDWELVIRVIWCLKRNEINIKNDSRAEFLSRIGVTQANTGVYSQDYCNEVLKNEIAQTKKYSQNACIILITPDNKNPEDELKFINIIKDSIRTNDTIIKKDDIHYYIYLQKTKLNGAYSVFERINQNTSASAGVVEVLNQDFDDIKSSLQKAAAQAAQHPGSLIVASQFYNQIETPELNIDLTTVAIEEKPKEPIKVQTKTNTYDSKSLRLFNKMYLNKLNVVITPIFKKYENLIRNKYPNLQINTNVGQTSYFKATNGIMSAVLEFIYDGAEKVTLNADIIDNGRKRLSETESINFVSIDHDKVSLMLKELMDEFIAVSRTGN